MKLVYRTGVGGCLISVSRCFYGDSLSTHFTLTRGRGWNQGFLLDPKKGGFMWRWLVRLAR